MASQLLDLMSDATCYPVLLRLGSKCIPMQSLILKQWSRVLADVLDNTASSSNDGPITIPMDVAKQDWLTVMELIYPVPGKHTVAWANLEVLMRVADKYDMPAIMSKCEDFLVANASKLTHNRFGSRSAFVWIALADKYGLSNLACTLIDSMLVAFTAQDENQRPEEITAQMKRARSFAHRCTPEFVAGLSGATARYLTAAMGRHSSGTA